MGMVTVYTGAHSSRTKQAVVRLYVTDPTIVTLRLPGQCINRRNGKRRNVWKLEVCGWLNTKDSLMFSCIRSVCRGSQPSILIHVVHFNRSHALDSYLGYTHGYLHMRVLPGQNKVRLSCAGMLPTRARSDQTCIALCSTCRPNDVDLHHGGCPLRCWFWFDREMCEISRWIRSLICDDLGLLLYANL
jgi:hypothetical protein